MLRALLLAVLLAATPALAQTVSVRDAAGQLVRLDANADTDGDGIDNALELGGFEFDIVSGDLVPWDGDPEATYFITDPLRASTDGDPYSDLQEATGANMPSSVRAPYNHPLVAARPVVAVYLTEYEVLPNGTITDEAGRTQSDAFTNETRSETTAGVSIGAEVSLNPFALASASVEATYSETWGTTQSSTSTSGFNWSSARTVEEARAATLRLQLYYQNLGSAPASNVRPTVSVQLGSKVIATFAVPDNDIALSLAPGVRYPASRTIEVSEFRVGLNSVDIFLTLRELQALQNGAPLRVSVPQVEATIQRWNPASQSFDNEVTWTAFEDDIDPVAFTIEAVVDGVPQQYQVYATVPGVEPRRRTIREALELVFDVEDTPTGVTIDGRSYPLDWYLATDAQPLLDNWEAAGRPQNLLGVETEPGTRLVMLSSGGGEPRVNFTTYSRDLAQVYVSALPIDGFPVQRAVATLFLEDRVVEVPLDASNGTAFRTNADPIDVPYYGGFVTVTNSRGDAQVRQLAQPAAPTRFRACADLTTPVDGTYALYMTGRVDRPVLVDCDFPESGAGLPTEAPWARASDADDLVDANRIFEVYAVDEATALLAVSANSRAEELLRSTDGGQTWAEASVPSPASDITGLDFADAQTGFATATNPTTSAFFDSIVLRTTNGGASWTRVPTPYDDVPSGEPGRRLTAVSVLDADRVLAVGGGGSGNGPGGGATVLRTTDGGASWRPLDVDTPRYPFLSFDAVSYRQGADSPYITLADYDLIVTSLDDGATWQTFEPSALDGVAEGAVVDLSFPTAEVGYAVVSDGFRIPEGVLLKTTDAGRTWAVVFKDPGDTVTDVHFFTADEGFAVGGTDTVLHTVDGGETWYRQTARTSGGRFRDVHVRDGLGLVAADTGDPNDPNGRAFVTTPSANFAAGPRGETYTIRPQSLLAFDGVPTRAGGSGSPEAALGAYDVVLLGEGREIIEGYADADEYNAAIELVRRLVEDGTDVYGTIDIGVTTANLPVRDGSTEGPNAAILYRMLYWANEGYFDATGVVLANAGAAFGVDRARRCDIVGLAQATFQTRVIVTGLTPEEAVADAEQPCGAYSAEQARLGVGDAVLVEGYQVRDGSFVEASAWRSEADALGVLEPYGIEVFSLATGDAYAQAAFDYAWFSAVVDEHAAVGWADADRGASDDQPLAFTAPEADPGRTYFSDLAVDLPTVQRTTEGGTITIDTQARSVTFGARPVAAEEAAPEAEPVLELAQSFPNPTRGRATILYRLGEPGPVRLAVYDLLGREVAVLVDEPKAAGDHEATLDAAGFASGVYVYRLTAGDRAETRRLTVVR
ncbi:MAG: binary toxin-like calcium binding domain-containing protein [Bacteroidota bacterium]